tara:strand:- start:368 stop:832 length:465 start_codon:yes stop_codon:yes gene_type:complete
MNLFDSIKSYENSLSNVKSSGKKKSSGGDNSDTVTRTNKKTDMQFASIMHTNNAYNQKMFKSLNNPPTYRTFESEDEFERFIYDDSKTKHTGWKQIPMCFKRQMCEEYVMNDESLSEVEKKDFVLKFDNTFLNQGIKYDARAGHIVNINYTLLQ